MAYYLKCYSEGNSSYFALGYRVLSKALYMLHCNEYVLIGVIASLISCVSGLHMTGFYATEGSMPKRQEHFCVPCCFIFNVWGFLFLQQRE